MDISVIYTSGERSVVDNVWLQVLIETRTIKAFRRCSGWIILGKDFVRKSRGIKPATYSGQEKRRVNDFFVLNI
jgi:hypothetical protein